MKNRSGAIILFFLISVSTKAYSQHWKQLSDSAKSYSDSKNYDSAIALYSQAKDELQKDSLHTGTFANTCNSLAGLYRRVAEYKKAEPLYLEVKQIREDLFGKNSAGYVTACNNLGHLYYFMGDYKKAELLYTEARQIGEKIFGKEDADYYAVSCNGLALVNQRLGKYPVAISFSLEALEITEKKRGKRHIDYARICNNLGVTYSDMGQYKKAEIFYLNGKNTLAELLGGQNPDYARFCNNLALLDMDMGDFEKAEALYFEANQIFLKTPGEESPDYAQGCHNLAILYARLGQNEKAESLFLKGKQIREQVLGKENSDYASSCEGLANIYIEMENYKGAEILEQEARQIRERVFGKEHPEYASSCENLGDVYQALGQRQKAEAFLLEAKLIREKVPGKEHLDYVRSCNNLGGFYYDIGENKKAEPLFLEARNISERIFGDEHPDYTQSCLNLANLYWNMKEPQKAGKFYAEAFRSQSLMLKQIFDFTSETEKQSYLKKTGDLKNYLLSFNMLASPLSGRGVTYDINFSERNLILSSFQKLRNTIYDSGDSSLKKKYDSWINIREQLSFWFSKPVAERPAYVKDIELQANALEKELTRLSSGFEKNQLQNNITWRNIQQHLTTNEAAIEFAEFHLYNGKRWTDSTWYAALLLTKSLTEPKLIPLFESSQLNNIAETGNTLNTVAALYGKQKVGTSYNLIWRPVEKYLKGITKIYFAPAGILHRIAFQALPVNDHQVLSDKYQLVQLNTTASVIDQSTTLIDHADKLALYGGINYYADSVALKQANVAYHNTPKSTRSLPEDITRGNVWQYLPSSATEINEIESIGKQKKYSVTILKGVSASEESIKALSAENSPAVLHIATHGFFFADKRDEKRGTGIHNFGAGDVFKQSDDPLLRSGLLFAGANYAWKGKQVNGVEDGILTANEVSNLYLPNTKLVVLSACETGLGDIKGNEGVYGLQRSFKMAGVQNLVMSLWKVHDKETAEFMKYFYTNIFNQQSINDAFSNAQKIMKNKYRDQPFKWAAWTLVR